RLRAEAIDRAHGVLVPLVESTVDSPQSTVARIVAASGSGSDPVDCRRSTVDSLRVLVSDAPGVSAVAAACRRAGEVAFDLGFVSEGRMRPELGLVQVAWVAGDAVEVRAIDAVAVDPRPVLELFTGEVALIAHAARQDLQLLAARFDLRVSRLFDTQIAAAFV